MEDINKQVMLLAILKKEEDESINDVLLKLENSGVFSLKEGKKLLKELKNDSFVVDGALSISGIAKAKEAQRFFTL
ncbi:MAG: hypothetical protein GX118_08630 [Arcobacter butzleri]|jgi:hypothetical protein|nr:hypothetical protein [Arcobacteraceae bacterium]MDY0365923.1 hypothetical protein [Arcobacteraceae bacterium]NLO18233.1 hypothetical protein [Aliarcobacter butzleri]